jgi:hypothetical protein
MIGIVSKLTFLSPPFLSHPLAAPTVSRMMTDMDDVPSSNEEHSSPEEEAEVQASTCEEDGIEVVEVVEVGDGEDNWATDSSIVGLNSRDTDVAANSAT